MNRESVKATPDLASGLFCFVPLHKISYSIGIFSIGTSFNGLGNKDSKICILTPEEAAALEREMDKYFNSDIREYQGENLKLKTFTLD